MSLEFEIVTVTEKNLDQHPGVICFINPKHEFYPLKIEWLKQQYKNGLSTKLLYVPAKKAPVGFIEYIPGEHCWRAVDAKGYMFIHCLWTNGKKLQHQGLGSALLAECEKDATDMSGVAVVTSDKAFMQTKDIFIKNGYLISEESGKEQLLYKSFTNEPAPRINNWQEKLAKLDGLHMIYTRQCPWVARFIEEVKPVLAEHNLEPTITELTTAHQVQNGPSLYGTFNLVYNGKLLADRYISVTRFKNILKKIQ